MSDKGRLGCLSVTGAILAGVVLLGVASFVHQRVDNVRSQAVAAEHVVVDRDLPLSGLELTAVLDLGTGREARFRDPQVTQQLLDDGLEQPCPLLGRLARPVALQCLHLLGDLVELGGIAKSAEIGLHRRFLTRRPGFILRRAGDWLL